ncbi:mucin-like protein [Scheffersomyces xylosifermentans]|uniref:mucin-like protein n=1 Tax=Scheffersomyces xylosifermentans TaxID=1304137 RepID=UPI00315D9CD5
MAQNIAPANATNSRSSPTTSESPTKVSPQVVVKMEAGASVDTTASIASSSSTATIKSPLFKKENLTATKLTNIFANAPSSPPIVPPKSTNTDSTNKTALNSQLKQQSWPTQGTQVQPQTHTQPNPVPQPIHHAHKYTKIQPAIAPKPIAVLPKPSNFSPIPNKTIALQHSTSDSLTNSNLKTSLNINTSKRWVLPPRPRPGRKPTAISPEADEKAKSVNNSSLASSPSASKISPKKRPKIKKEPITENKPITAVGTGLSTSSSQKGHNSTSINATSSPVITRGEQQTTNVSKGFTNEADKKQIINQLQQQYPKVANNRAKATPAHTPIPATSLMSPTSSSASTLSSTPTSSSVSTSASPIPPPPPPVVTGSSDPKTEIMNLKLSYLSKLKEQELIRNYIEVISNQIKELSFVQNGVITFDALKTGPSTANGKIKRVNSPSAAATVRASSYDQLESINNLNDLNKFLNYLTKSSNIIHSATKQKASNGTGDTVLNKQIDHYLDIRAKFKSMKTEELNKLNNLKKQQRSGQAGPGTSIGSLNDLPNVASASSDNSKVQGNAAAQVATTSFIPDLLKPLRAANLFDQDTNENVVIDIVKDDTKIDANLVSPDNNILSNDDIDMFMEENDFLNRLILSDGPDTIDEVANVEVMKEQEQESLGNVKIHHKGESVATQDSLIKKKSKLNCGFCTNDTPCLCFDADFDIGILRH